MSQSDNHIRWAGQPGHYEVWYLTGNHRDSDTGYWIRYTLESPLPGHGDPYAQLWFAFFDARDPDNNIAFNRKYHIAELAAHMEPFAVTIAGSEFTHQSARGSLQSGDKTGDHRVSWDLRWQPSAETHRHLPSLMYQRGGLGETTVLAPNLDVAASGVIRCDDRTFELRDQPFGQTHLWGTKHAHKWAWGHCNAFDDRPGAAFEILSVCLKRAGHVLPPLTIFTLYLDGKAHRFNEFHHTPITRSRTRTARFAFSATGLRTRIEGEFTCRPDDMVVAPYVDPDGEPSFCANTEVADLHILVYERSGFTSWREVADLRASRRGHFELGQRERDTAIVADHVTLE